MKMSNVVTFLNRLNGVNGLWEDKSVLRGVIVTLILASSERRSKSKTRLDIGEKGEDEFNGFIFARGTAILQNTASRRDTNALR